MMRRLDIFRIFKAFDNAQTAAAQQTKIPQNYW